MVEVALWGGHQPGTAEGCVVSTNGDQDKLHDYPCSEVFHFICEKTSMDIVY